MRHYEGGKTSTKINKILDFVREGHSLDETINKFKTDAWNADDITKVFNDYKNGVYIYVPGTPERIERVQVVNPDWFPLFNGTEEKNEEIIENYNENSSTPAVGRGYHNYSMSNNAVDAYKKGSMPLSKWNKKNIIEKIADITEKYNIPFDVSKLDKMTLKDIKDEYLKKDSYHHTSKFYNISDFYKVDIEKILENKENTQAKKTENFTSFEELQEAFKNDIEKAPEDYKISNLNEALKDLGITENKPKKVKTPYETIQVRARNIEHIISNEGDKSRYKSINRMFATLERPNIITVDEQGKRAYFKIFEGNNKIKRQITYVSTDEQGNFVLTTIPIKRNKKFINAINKGNIIYESRKGVINNSPDNNSITDVDTNLNPKTVHLYNISEKKKSNIIHQNTNKNEPEQQNIFPGNREAKKIHQVKGGYLPAEKFIELFKNADASTIVHELAHW